MMRRLLASVLALLFLMGTAVAAVTTVTTVSNKTGIFDSSNPGTITSPVNSGANITLNGNSAGTTTPLTLKGPPDGNQSADLLDVYPDGVTKSVSIGSNGNFHGNIGRYSDFGQSAPFSPLAMLSGLTVDMGAGASADIYGDPALSGGIESPTHLRLHAIASSPSTSNEPAVLEFYQGAGVPPTAQYLRWTVRKDDTPETGSNAGSNFDIWGGTDINTGGYDGQGGGVGTGYYSTPSPPFTITRANGNITMPYAVNIGTYSTSGTRAAAAAVTVGTSPYSYADADSSMETVYIYGGTVTNISLVRNATATQIGSSTGLSVVLSPGDAVQVTYSAAPTMVKVLF